MKRNVFDAAAVAAFLRKPLTEKTSYGVYSGLGVTAQETPDMTVNVAAGTIYMANGTRFTPVANAALAVTAADATNPRIDIVYVNASGVIAYLAGTAASSPAVPSVPTGGQVLARIAVAAEATTITASVIADVRKMIGTPAWNYIETVTLAEAAASFTKTYVTGYKGFRVLANTAAGSDLTVYFTIKSGANTISDCPISSLVNTGARYGAMQSCIDNGLWRTMRSSASTSETTSAWYELLTMTPISEGTYPTADNITINVHSGTIPAASVFKIYGLR